MPIMDKGNLIDYLGLQGPGRQAPIAGQGVGQGKGIGLGQILGAIITGLAATNPEYRKELLRNVNGLYQRLKQMGD